MIQRADLLSRTEHRWSGARDPAQARRRSRFEMIQDLRAFVRPGLKWKESTITRKTGNGNRRAGEVRARHHEGPGTPGTEPTAEP